MSHHSAQMQVARDVWPPGRLLTPSTTPSKYDITDDVPMISSAGQTHRARTGSAPAHFSGSPSFSSKDLLEGTFDIYMDGLGDDLGLADRFVDHGLRKLRVPMANYFGIPLS